MRDRGGADRELDSHFSVAAFVKTPKRRVLGKARRRHFHKYRYEETCCRRVTMTGHTGAVE